MKTVTAEFGGGGGGGGVSTQSRCFSCLIRFSLVCWPFNILSLVWRRFDLNVEERDKKATCAKADFYFNFPTKFSCFFLHSSSHTL